MSGLYSSQNGNVWILDSGPGGREFGVYASKELADIARSWHSQNGRLPDIRVTEHAVNNVVRITE